MLRWLQRVGQFRHCSLAFVGFGLLTAAMTAPLAWRIGRVLPDHDDAYFSVWRLAWVAHQLPIAPSRLFDANIFHPARRVLLLSDAMVLLGALGAVPTWLGVHPVLVHNALYLLGFFFSGFCAFLLARELTGESGPAWLAGIIFAFAPYRFGHYGHLELQWACFMPLALLAAHRLFGGGTLGHGVWLGLALAAQGLCSLYYVALFVPVFAIILIGLADRRPVAEWKKRIGGFLVAAIVAGAILGPYLLAYSRSGVLNERSSEDLGRYSATLTSYLQVAPSNRPYAALRQTEQPDELSLFPGIVAVLCAAAALRRPRSRLVVAYFAALVTSFLLSLGPRGGVFPLLRLILPPFAHIRAPARAGILVLLSLAVLAALGVHELGSRMRRRAAAICILLLGVACLFEYWSAPMRVFAPALKAPAAHEWLAHRPPGTVVVELPASVLHVDLAPVYDYLSIYHWQKVVNGYSGFYPAGYPATEALLQTFPDAASIRHLRELAVSYVIVHPSLYRPDDYGRVAAQLVGNPNFGPPVVFRDAVLPGVVVPLKPEGP